MTIALLDVPQLCPSWCVTVHDREAVEHFGETHQVAMSTCLHRRYEEHVAYERETADGLGFPVQPLSAALVCYLREHPASGITRVWIGLDESDQGYYATLGEAAAYGRTLVALGRSGRHSSRSSTSARSGQTSRSSAALLLNRC